MAHIGAEGAEGGGGGSEARLSNWDGYFAVESTASVVCCSPFLKRRSQWNVNNCNGYELSAADADRKDEKNIADREHDQSQNYGNDSTSATDTDMLAKRSIGWRGKPNETATAYHCARDCSSIICAGCDRINRHSSSRLDRYSRQTNMGSSLLGDSMTEIIIEDTQNDHEPTSALLDYCKRKFLKPYVAILTLVGLNPISTETTLCRACLSYLHVTLILVLLLFGYFLQYLTSYRGDRGFSNYHKHLPTISIAADTPEGAIDTIGELLFGYVIPNMLHLMGFITAVIVCKIVDNEQLQNLIERVFLSSMKPRRLCIMLWLYIALGVAFLCLLFAYVMPSVLMQTQIVKIKLLSEILRKWQLATKITLLGTIFVQDIVEIIILTSYCVECYLLRVHLATLSHKLLMHSVEGLDWMREVLEFRKLLDHLNQRVAVPVCFFIVMNLSYAFAGLVYLFKDFDFHYSALKVVVLNIINVILWLVMGLVPFFMAASVTRVCQTAQANGHQIRVRPFVYHNTSSEDLNSMLLFASSLDMSAKLFRMPIQANYLCFAILVISIVILTLGMCFNLSVLGTI